MIRLYFIVSLVLFYSCTDSKQTKPVVNNSSTSINYETISLLGDTLYASPPTKELISRYQEKKVAYEKDPTNIDQIIWYGRFTAYLGNYNEAIKIYSDAIEQYPGEARLYRHRGHRYITIRNFDKAIEDFTTAVVLIKGKENSIEPDGMPNPRNIPVSTLHGNIYYHLGLAQYLNRDLGPALKAFKQCLETSNNPDNIVSATHWIYMINKRLGRDKAAENYLRPIHATMDVIENQSYLQACLFYKGEISLDEIQLGNSSDTPSNTALSYAIANWWYYTGYAEKAKELYTEIVGQDDWASFGYIAAENDLAKLY